MTHPDIIRFFMTIPEACRLVMEAVTMGEGNEIFVFEMGKAVKIVDLATRMIELAGYRPDEDIKIEFTGLRPGEKLYEEVLSDKENTIPTENKKIMIAKVRRYEYADILDIYAEFEKLSRAVRIMDTVNIGQEVEVLTKDGRKLAGILKDADEEKFTVAVQKKVKLEGAKRPKLQEEDETFTYEQIKYTKYLISFK